MQEDSQNTCPSCALYRKQMITWERQVLPFMSGLLVFFVTYTSPHSITYESKGCLFTLNIILILCKNFKVKTLRFILIRKDKDHHANYFGEAMCSPFCNTCMTPCKDTCLKHVLRVLIMESE